MTYSVMRRPLTEYFPSRGDGIRVGMMVTIMEQEERILKRIPGFLYTVVQRNSGTRSFCLMITLGKIDSVSKNFDFPRHAMMACDREPNPQQKNYMVTSAQN